MDQFLLFHWRITSPERFFPTSTLHLFFARTFFSTKKGGSQWLRNKNWEKLRVRRARNRMKVREKEWQGEDMESLVTRFLFDSSNSFFAPSKLAFKRNTIGNEMKFFIPSFHFIRFILIFFLHLCLLFVWKFATLFILLQNVDEDENFSYRRDGEKVRDKERWRKGTKVECVDTWFLNVSCNICSLVITHFTVSLTVSLSFLLSH